MFTIFYNFFVFYTLPVKGVATMFANPPKMLETALILAKLATPDIFTMHSRIIGAIKPEGHESYTNVIGIETIRKA